MKDKGGMTHLWWFVMYVITLNQMKEKGVINDGS